MSKRSKSLPPSVMSVEVVEEIFEQLKGLSPQEQAIIRPVLERDLEFQRREKARVRQLRSMVDMHLIDQMPPPPMSARRKSGYGLMNSVSSESMMSVCSLRSNMQALPGSADQPSGRICFHCQSRLGLIFNAGTKCAKCGCLLCNECRRGTPRSKWLCQNCHAKRELMAASGEWVDAGDPAEISEVLLAQMRRAAMEKELKEKENEINGQSKGLKTYSFVNVEDMEESISVKTPMLSKRNLTLPTIATPSLLAVPSDSEGNISNRRAVSATDKFWGGSPSSRTPQGGFVGTPNYNIAPPPDNLVAEHYIVRERIGSPAPRSPPSFMSPNSPNSPIPTSPPATEIAPPTPTSPNPMASPKTGPRRMAYATSKSSRASITIDSDKLLQPVDNRRPLRRQWTNPAEGPDQCPKPCMDAAHPSSHHRAQSTNYVPVLPPPPRNEHYTSRVITSPNPDMRQQMPTKTTAVKVEQRANNNSGRMPADWQATAASAAASKPVHDTSVRRQRPQSQGPVTVRKMKMQTQDHLDVSSSESRRSSGNSLPPSRSASQEARLHTKLDDSKRITKSNPSILAKDDSKKQTTELQVAKQRGSKSVPDLPPPPRKLAIVPNHRSPSTPTAVLHVSKIPVSVRQRSPSPARKVTNPGILKKSPTEESNHQVPLPTPGHKLSISPNHKVSNTSATGRQPPITPNNQTTKAATGHQPTKMPSEGLKLSIAKDSIAIYSKPVKPSTGQQPSKIPNHRSKKESQPEKEPTNGSDQLNHKCSNCGHTSSNLQKQGGRVITPASSRDSLSVASYATETSTDGCTKASVASQASSQAATFLGEVQLILSYDIRSACFCVHIIQCRSLPHFGSHKPNPYVKVVLVARDTGLAVLKNKTTPRKGEANPVFDQILKFPRITKSELEQYYLLLSVWHKDLLAQNASIGEASISLRDYDWDSPCPLWYQLEGKTVGNSSGSMSMETSESERAHSPDVLALGSRTTDRPAVPASTRRTIFRNASTNSSTSSRNSRGVRKAVLQRKADGAEEEREPKKVASRKSVELEHDIPSPKSKRSTSKESEIEDQATDWTIWI